jgi:hypothetical protein
VLVVEVGTPIKTVAVHLNHQVAQAVVVMVLTITLVVPHQQVVEQTLVVVVVAPVTLVAQQLVVQVS